MTRPCFLVIDREHSGSISTRKLVIETAKLNVITAYSGTEAIEMLDRFPNVDGIVLDAGISDMTCSQVVQQLKNKRKEVPIVVIGTPSGARCDHAEFYLPSFEPAKLLNLLGKMTPEVVRVIDREQAELPTEA